MDDFEIGGMVGILKVACEHMGNMVSLCVLSQCKCEPLNPNILWFYAGFGFMYPHILWSKTATATPKNMYFSA